MQSKSQIDLPGYETDERSSLGKRPDRRRWRKQGGERSAAVCVQRSRVDGKAHTNPEEIKQNLIAQLTASVRWTQEVEAMVEAGATEFVECGPGQALTGMITKIAKGATVLHA